MVKKIGKYRTYKIIEMVVLLVLEAVFLGIIIANKTMRTSIFVDKSLFILCAVTYFTVILFFIAILIDIIAIRNLKIESRELENIAYYDTKTGIPNRTSCNRLFAKYSTIESMKGIGCIVTEIENIRDINKQKGKTYGDKVILDFCRIFETCSENFGFCGRNGGNEFLTVIEDCNVDNIRSFSEFLSESVKNYNNSHSECTITIRSEYALFDYEDVESFSELLSRAYAKLKSN